MNGWALRNKAGVVVKKKNPKVRLTTNLPKK